MDFAAADGSVISSVAVPQMWDATHDAMLGAPITEEWDESAQPALWANGHAAPAGTGEPSSAPAPRGQGKVAKIPTTVAISGTNARQTQ